MQECTVERRYRCLLATMLRSGRGKHASDLAHQCPFDPKTTGLVEEITHLRGHVAKTRWRSEDDCIVLRKLLDRRQWRFLVYLHAGLPGHVLGHQFRHALNHHLGPGDGSCTLSDGLSHF